MEVYRPASQFHFVSLHHLRSRSPDIFVDFLYSTLPVVDRLEGISRVSSCGMKTSIPYASIDSILDLSRCFSSTIGRAVKAESMARASQLQLILRPVFKGAIIRGTGVYDGAFGGL